MCGQRLCRDHLGHLGRVRVAGTRTGGFHPASTRHPVCVRPAASTGRGQEGAAWSASAEKEEHWTARHGPNSRFHDEADGPAEVGDAGLPRSGLRSSPASAASDGRGNAAP